MNDAYQLSFFGEIAQSFAWCGWFAYPIAALGCLLPLLALGILILALFSKTNRVLPASMLLLALSGLPPTLSVLGAQLVGSSAEEALVHADPGDRDVIRAGTEGEVLNLHLWGLGAAIIPSFLGCALLGLGLGRLDRFRTPA